MNQLWLSAITYASTLVLVTQGFVLMYKTTRVPNFSIGVFMTLGAYVAFTNTKIVGLPYYLGVLFAFVSGAFVSLLISVFVFEPLIRRGRTLVQMSIVTIAIGIVMENTIQVVTLYYDDLFMGQRTHLHIR